MASHYQCSPRVPSCSNSTRVRNPRQMLFSRSQNQRMSALVARFSRKRRDCRTIIFNSRIRPDDGPSFGRYTTDRSPRYSSYPVMQLIDAIWPDVAVTEDSLVQCLIEIRKALGRGCRSQHSYWPDAAFPPASTIRFARVHLLNQAAIESRNDRLLGRFSESGHSRSSGAVRRVNDLR
jgi:hypothetical protein